jgi:Zn-dependent peptidase ImmA (M78 family)
MSGCLSIINLNLLSLGDNEQTDQIRLEAGRLKAAYLELSTKAAERLTVLEKEAQRHQAYHRELQALASGQLVGSKLSYAEIEELARRLQNTLWKYRDKISKQATPENAIEVLKPEVVLTKILNYQYEESETLGQYYADGELFEIAGIIDKSKRSVAVSLTFSKQTRNFTAAHELGHALLHRQTVLHRDKAVDGSGAGNSRVPIELQADKFATYFLMPKKLVKGLFKQLFLTDKFTINENTVFALNERSVSVFMRERKDLRGLTKFLASAEHFAGESFRSMAEIFQVSVETMAIRLEELELVEF